MLKKVLAKYIIWKIAFNDILWSWWNLTSVTQVGTDSREKFGIKLNSCTWNSFAKSQEHTFQMIGSPGPKNHHFFTVFGQKYEKTPISAIIQLSKICILNQGFLSLHLELRDTFFSIASSLNSSFLYQRRSSYRICHKTVS